MSGRFRSAERAPRLIVDPIACDGVRLCVQLAPGLIDLDRWGYPILPGRALTKAEVRSARRAASGCPKRALGLAASD
jgi:ferredoxin